MDPETIKAVRNELPVLSDTVYLNTGTAGPMSLKVIARMKKALDDQAAYGRINIPYYKKLETLKNDIRTSIAELISCSFSEIALTRSTSEGLNIVINGLRLGQEDEVLTTNGEHITVYAPLWNLKKKGVSIKMIDVLNDYKSCTAQLKTLISSRTKLICLSHVVYCSGDLLPVREICKIAKEKGIPVLLDGAQSFCMLPVNVKETGCTFYAAPGQKWAGGPEGTGFLYISEDGLPLIEPVFPGYGSVKAFDFNEGLTFWDDARQFETGTWQPANLQGFHEALKAAGSVDLLRAFERSKSLGKHFRHLLSDIPEIGFVSPEITSALIAFTVKDIPSEKVASVLFEKGITVRNVPITNAVRLSVGYFNTEDELELAANYIRQLLA